jgi:hypothetical protein
MGLEDDFDAQFVTRLGYLKLGTDPHYMYIDPKDVIGICVNANAAEGEQLAIYVDGGESPIYADALEADLASAKAKALLLAQALTPGCRVA